MASCSSCCSSSKERKATITITEDDKDGDGGVRIALELSEPVPATGTIPLYAVIAMRMLECVMDQGKARLLSIDGKAQEPPLDI